MGAYRDTTVGVSGLRNRSILCLSAAKWRKSGGHWQNIYMSSMSQSFSPLQSDIKASVVPEVCCEKTGDALNRRNPQWKINSSLAFMCSVLLGCLLTSTCITDIWKH